MTPVFLSLIVVSIIAKLTWDYHKPKGKLKTNGEAFQSMWRFFLENEVDFYQRLTPEERKRFEKEILKFLSYVEIKGARCKITDQDKLLVATSAVIPLFGFNKWHYSNLNTVILLPNRFDLHFNSKGPNRNIIGLVGKGRLSGIMHLSQKHLRLGYSNKTDRKNVGIHEFIHLIDMADGDTDGIPKFMLKQPAVIPWIDMIHEKIIAIDKKDSDINPYGATNKIEFFAVASEYFFETPRLLKKKHPKLYDLMSKAFNNDYATKKLQIIPLNNEVGRNDKCPCGSDEKYKHCCLG